MAAVLIAVPIVALPALRHMPAALTFFIFLVFWAAASLFLPRRYGASLAFDPSTRTLIVTTFRVFSTQTESFSARELARVEMVRHGYGPGDARRGRDPGDDYSLRLVIAATGPATQTSPNGPRERMLVLDRSKNGDQLRAQREAITVFFAENEMDMLVEQIRSHSDS